MKKRPALNTIFTSWLALTLMAGMAAAQGMPSGCYYRGYSASHLASHPAQGVSEIWIRFAPSAQNGARGQPFAIAARMGYQGQAARDRVQGMLLTEAGTCYPGERRCAVSCDGGGFRIVSSDGQGLLIETSGTRVAAMPCGGPSSAYSTLVEIPGQSTRYRLNRVPDSYCRGL